MKKNIIPILLILIVFGCNSEKKQNPTFENRVWLDFENDYELYVSSKDNTIYVWSATFVGYNRGSFPSAENIPEDHNTMKDLTAATLARKDAWIPFIYYKVKGDSITLQHALDTKGEDLLKGNITFLNDTTIGVFDYHQAIIKGDGKAKPWYSKK